MHGKGEIEAYSAGSSPSGQIHPKAIRSMSELGYDLSQHQSKSISEIPKLEYDLVVSMGCGDECPFVPAKNREEWEIPDPKDMPLDEFHEVRDRIEAEVKKLMVSV
jgi:arsenate reductase (thioredoxin)